MAKKLISVILALILVLSLGVPVFAAGEADGAEGWQDMGLLFEESPADEVYEIPIIDAPIIGTRGVNDVAQRATVKPENEEVDITTHNAAAIGQASIDGPYYDEFWSEDDNLAYEVIMDFNQSAEGYILIERGGDSGWYITVTDENNNLIFEEYVAASSALENGNTNPKMYSLVPISKPANATSATFIVTMQPYSYYVEGSSGYYISTGDISELEEYLFPTGWLHMQLNSYIAMYEERSANTAYLSESGKYIANATPYKNSHFYLFTPTTALNDITLTNAEGGTNMYVSGLKIRIYNGITGAPLIDSAFLSGITRPDVDGSNAGNAYVHRLYAQMTVGQPYYIEVYQSGSTAAPTSLAAVKDGYELTAGDVRWWGGSSSHEGETITTQGRSTSPVSTINVTGTPAGAMVYEFSLTHSGLSTWGSEWYMEVDHDNYGTRVFEGYGNYVEIPFNKAGYGTNFLNMPADSAFSWVWVNRFSSSYTFTPELRLEYYFPVGGINQTGYNLSI